MDLAGLLMVLFGAYLIDSALKHRPPLSALQSIVKDPAKARSTLASTATGSTAGSGAAGAPTSGATGTPSAGTSTNGSGGGGW